MKDLHDTHIQGIPCTVELEYHEAHSGAREGGQLLEPDEPAYSEVVKVYKRGGKGKPMRWLFNKITEEDRTRIMEEARG